MDVEYNYDNKNTISLNNNIELNFEIEQLNKESKIRENILINLKNTIDKQRLIIYDLKNEIIVKEEMYNYNLININNDYTKLNDIYTNILIESNELNSKLEKKENNNLLQEINNLKLIINYKNNDIAKLTNIYMIEFTNMDAIIKEYKKKNIFNSYYLITMSIFFISYILYDFIKV
jgi:hypothetical protein